MTLQSKYSEKSKIGLILLLIGLFLVIMSTQNQFFTRTSQYRVDPGAMGLPDAYNIMGPVYDSKTTIDIKRKNNFLYTGAAFMLLGGILFIKGEQKTGSKPFKIPVIEKQHEKERINTPNYVRPQININLPKINWDAEFSKLKEFLVKKKTILLSIAGILITFLVIYNLVLKPHPVKDAKNLAKNFCICTEELNKNNLTSMQSFFNTFESNNFKSRVDARNLLNDILEENQAKYTTCTQAATIKYTEILADYHAKGGEDVSTLQQAYNSIINACGNTNESNITALRNQINEKIKTIIDQEPDIDKIKADLLGRQILGWNFEFLNEFKNTEILNIARANDRIEYQIKLGLINNRNNSEHECEVMVNYLQDDNGWYLDNVTLNYITYTNTFYADKYIRIMPLENSIWSAENNYKMSWKTSEWEYAGETITGPNEGSVSIPTSPVYYIKSLEGREIKVKFTYKPIS